MFDENGKNEKWREEMEEELFVKGIINGQVKKKDWSSKKERNNWRWKKGIKYKLKKYIKN